MPESWQDAQLIRQRKQGQDWQTIGSGGSLRYARVLRAGRLASTEEASFWDLVILTDSCDEIDLNRGQFAGTTDPVRPYVPSASSPIEEDPDGIVRVWIPPGRTQAAQRTCEDTGDGYSVTPVAAEGKAIIVSKTEQCQGYFQSAVERFAGMRVSGLGGS